MVTATMGDRGSNVGEIVDRRVEEGLAEKVAYIAADATLTYEALRRQINRAAGLLRELGVRREQRVLLVLDDTTVFPIVFLAAMKLGAVPVPVSVLDKEENFRHYVADTHTELVVTGEDVTFSTTKLFHAYGLGNGLSFPLWFGATSVLMTGPTKPESILHTLRTHRPTVFYSVPALFGALVREPAADGALDSVRVCASAAEPLPGPTVLRWRERFGLDIVDGIGSTEMRHIYCSNRPGELEPGTSGRPVPGYELRLVGEDGEVLTGPAVGGLEVRGDSCAAFYWHQHEKSKHSMRGEWFATGDRYERREDGAYAYVGRLDDMLKVGGLWVSPIDMEFVLMEHPRVRGVGVVGVTIDHASRIAAFVEIAGDPEDTGDAALADELRDFCKQRLRRYEYPHVVRFVEELPRTLTGKVQRFALRDAIALSPMPEPAVRAEAPRTL